MASFLRKFVKAKSRSKSPVKQPYGVVAPSGAEHVDERVWLHDPNYCGHGIHEPYQGYYQHYPQQQPAPSSSSLYADKLAPAASYTPPGHIYGAAPHDMPYGARRQFFDVDELSDPNDVAAAYHMSRRQSPPSGRRKSPKRKSLSPTRRLPAKSLVSSSFSQPQSSPMLSSQPQYYFTPDYKLYEDVASERELLPAQQPYSPVLSGRSSNPNSNTTTTYYHEVRPSSSNTLSPTWHNADRRGRSGPISTTLRPTSSEYMNGGVAGTPYFGRGSMLAPSTPSGVGTSLADQHRFATSNGCLSKGAGVAAPAASGAIAPPSPGKYYVPGASPLSITRPRSVSPRKPLKGDSLEERKFRSRSPTKRSSTRSSIARTLDYLHAQCKLEGCSAVIIVEDTQFLVCKHQLSHASEFFRTLFLNNRALPVEGVRQTSINEYTIVVSGLKHPPQSVQFQWFIESTVLCPVLKPITDNSLETCMRLSKRFAARGLEIRCAKFIQDNVEEKPPMMALCWLNWVFKHRFDRATHDACVPVVARLPLRTLERHRQMLPERAVANLVAMKLRACYQQTAKVFYTIHKMDHFHVDMDRCPRCGRQREQGKVRVQANPCQKLIGCERCLRDIGCEIERKSGSDFEAFYQCEHGLWPFNDTTEDCHCQTALYQLNYRAAAYGVGSADHLDDGAAPAPSIAPIPPVSVAPAGEEGGIAATDADGVPLRRGGTLGSVSTLSRGGARTGAPTASALDIGGGSTGNGSKAGAISAVGGTVAAVLTSGSKSN